MTHKKNTSRILLVVGAVAAIATTSTLALAKVCTFPFFQARAVECEAPQTNGLSVGSGVLLSNGDVLVGVNSIGGLFGGCAEALDIDGNSLCLRCDASFDRIPATRQCSPGEIPFTFELSAF